VTEEASAQEVPGDRPASQEVVPLLEPRDGMPPVVVTQGDLAEATSRLGGGTGPVAVDAERASGYRYGQRAYLVKKKESKKNNKKIKRIKKINK